MTSSLNLPQGYTRDQWKEFINEWEQSGLSKIEFCNLKNLTPSSFYKWFSKFKNDEFLEDEFGIQEQGVKSSKTLKSSSKKRKKSRAPRYYTPEQWKKFIEEWKQSGLGQKSFCKQKGLTPSAFFRWRQTLGSSGNIIKQKAETQQSKSPISSIQDRFIPVTMTPSSFASSSPPKMEIVLSNGHRLYLQGAFDWQALSIWLNPLLVR